MSSAFPEGIPSFLHSGRGTVLLKCGCSSKADTVGLCESSASSGDAEDGKVELGPERASVVSI